MLARQQKKIPVSVVWSEGGFMYRGNMWKEGTVVYLRWGKGLELSKRLVLAVGSCKPRNCFVAALWRLSEDALCPKDARVIVCQLTYLVQFFLFHDLFVFRSGVAWTPNRSRVRAQGCWLASLSKHQTPCCLNSTASRLFLRCRRRRSKRR
jgi:hypothetical protein